ncbi:MAG: hypothetical protein GQ470_02845, partial [Gammaproteobacteria bacterium]|nr:hypothetical protein [Gammaproteobacteria bacterium]
MAYYSTPFARVISKMAGTERYQERTMKIGLLPFVIAGLLSGGLCWWLADHLPEPLLFQFFFGPVYPGVILGLTFLALGKLIGVVPSGHIFKHAAILIVAAILAQELILLTLGVQEVLFDGILYTWVLSLYPPVLSDELYHLVNSELLFFWLPTPMASGVQVFFIVLGVKLVWELPDLDPFIAAIYGAFFAMLTALFTSSVYEHIEYNINNTEGTPHPLLVWVFENMMLIVSPLLWYLLIFMAIYMTAKSQLNEDISKTDAVDDIDD